MKKIIFILFVCLFSRSVYPQQLIQAVKNEDQEQVKTLLSLQELTKPEKEKLLNTAKLLLFERYNKLNIFYSGKDMARLLCGFFLTSPIGLTIFSAGVGGTIFSCMTELRLLLLSLPTAYLGYKITAAGFRQVSNGWNLQTAQNNLNNIRSIVENINNKTALAA